MSVSCFERLAAVVLIVLIAFFGLWFFKDYIFKGDQYEKVELNDQRIKAFELYVSKIDSIGNHAIAILGVLWAFLIYKDHNVKSLNCWQTCIFVTTNIALIFSYLIYLYFYDYLINRLFYHSTIDIGAPFFENFRRTQFTFLIFGLLGFISLISVSYFKNSGGTNE